MSQPECPFCLGKHVDIKSRLCPNVWRKDDPDQNEEIPEQYISQYDQVPPLWLLTVGFSQHGKTCYIAALTLMLENLNRVWPETTWFPLDDYTRNIIQDTRRQAIEGNVPEHTEHLRPIFINTYDVPEFNDNCLVIYDAPGEIYKDFQTFGNDDYSLRPLKKVKNIWFLVSLSELDAHPENKINDLLNIYLTGMQRLKLPLAGRNLIVVYTMADKILNQLEYAFPKEIKDYIGSDPFEHLTDTSQPISVNNDISMKQYIKDMEDVSKILETYTIERVPGGGAFVKLARRSSMGLYFCINSALGSNPVDGKMKQDATRYRVLDPYIWALSLNIGDKQIPIKLVLDGSTESDPVYNKIKLLDLFENLSAMGTVATHILGQARQASVQTQAPPTKKPTIPKTRLIGPILERLENESVVVVITTGQIEDLADYMNSDWISRILLVNVGEEETQGWPNQVTIRENDTSTIVVDEFRRLFVNVK